jgi:hypothetical protein
MMALILTIIGCFSLGFAAGVAAILFAGVTHCDDCE